MPRRKAATKKSGNLTSDDLIAYNFSLRTKEEMDVNKVIRTSIVGADGKETGRYRYRVAGTGSNGTGMSKFVTEEKAKDIAKSFGLNITAVKGKPTTRRASTTSRGCKAAAERARKKCEDKKAKKAAKE